MTIKDTKHRVIHEGLVSVLGGENVSDDPSVMLAYARDWMPESTINPNPPPSLHFPNLPVK